MVANAKKATHRVKRGLRPLEITSPVSWSMFILIVLFEKCFFQMDGWMDGEIDRWIVESVVWLSRLRLFFSGRCVGIVHLTAKTLRHRDWLHEASGRGKDERTRSNGYIT
jgi:hypothetical protein